MDSLQCINTSWDFGAELAKCIHTIIPIIIYIWQYIYIYTDIMYACVHTLTRGTKEVLFGSIFHFNHIPTSLPRVETKCSNVHAESSCCFFLQLALQAAHLQRSSTMTVLAVSLAERRKTSSKYPNEHHWYTMPWWWVNVALLMLHQGKWYPNIMLGAVPKCPKSSWVITRT